jgi:hypothetical protein
VLCEEGLYCAYFREEETEAEKVPADEWRSWHWIKASLNTGLCCDSEPNRNL